MLVTPVFFILLVLLVITVPAWPYSRRWGYYPSAAITLALLILLLLLLWDRL